MKKRAQQYRFVLSGKKHHPSEAMTATFELPVDMVTHQRDLFDRLFNFAFDIMHFERLELRVQETAHRTRIVQR